jgi:hypothetical protein
MNIAYKAMRIIEADTQGELVAYYNWLLGAIDAHNKHDETSDQLAISRLSNPYEHFYKIKQTWRKDHWEEKVADRYSHLVRGDAVVVQRANFEFIAYDEKCPYKGGGFYYYYWFNYWKNTRYDPEATNEPNIRDVTPSCDEKRYQSYMQGVKLEQMKGPEFEPSDQEIEDYGQKVKEQNAQRNKEIIESWK